MKMLITKLLSIAMLAVAVNGYAGDIWTVSGLPAGITFDSKTGKFGGKATQVGKKVTISATAPENWVFNRVAFSTTSHNQMGAGWAVARRSGI